MDDCHSIGTPLATKPKLDVDLSGEPVDQSDYHSKIRSLMYLTSSRPDLVQAVCYRAFTRSLPGKNNIVPKPDLALELGKSISLTEAEEEAVAREVHATHARIVSGPDPEPMQEDQTRSNSGKLHVSLAGPNPKHMDDEFLTTAYPKVHENLKLITDERVIEENPESHSGSMSSMKNLDDTYNFGDQFLYDKPTEDDQEKSKVIEESDSTIPDLSHQTVTSTPPVIAPFTDVSSIKPSSLVSPPPINTEATTITTSLPEITPFIALQLRCKIKQEIFLCCVDEYLGTKLDDALLKILERHTADLIEKYSVLPGPESIKNQESEKSPKEIIRIKREQGEEKQDSTYSIRSTDKVAFEEFDLKSALFKHMNKNKTANRNPANYHLYHALMEALIADEDAMDKEVTVKVKDHKRKHDDDEDMRKKMIKALQLIKPGKSSDSSKKLKGSNEGQWEADVISEHFDRDDNVGDDNEEAKPDPEKIYNSGPAPSLMNPGYISSGLVQISVSPIPYGPVPQFMAPDHSSSGPVLHEMTSDQIRSDLTPNRQETSVDNISSDLVK
ncbi:hypothetical protein Tco_1507837 [Tanacetum coccineum]